MHILLIHQAFAALDEPGGTRHHELARYLVERGHRVTILASPVSYLTGKARQAKMSWVDRQEPEPGITILRTYTAGAAEVSVDPASDDLFQVPVLFLNGHEDPELQEGESLSLRTCLQNGGFLLVSACCSSPEFDAGLRRLRHGVGRNATPPAFRSRSS